MKSILCISILCYLLVPSDLSGQELKARRIKRDGFKLEYSVLKSDKSIKHGSYRKYDATGGLLIDGQYEDDRKAGEWSYYYKGQVEQIYDFDTLKIVEMEHPSLDYEVLQGPEFKEMVIDRAPTFIGGRAGLTEKLMEIITYPQEAIRLGIEGRMYVYVTIGDTDNLLDVSIAKGIDEFDNEVLSSLRQIQDGWISGIHNDRTVATRLIIPILFRFQSDGNNTVTID